MKTPFERGDSWSMNAVRFKDTMYNNYLKVIDLGFSYIEEDVDFVSRRAANRQHELAMFTGYKFEQLSTLDKTWDESSRHEIETRHENIVDNIQQYCSIVKTQLGSSSIIMGGEVDCLWGTPSTPPNPCRAC